MTDTNHFMSALAEDPPTMAAGRARPAGAYMGPYHFLTGLLIEDYRSHNRTARRRRLSMKIFLSRESVCLYRPP